MNHCDGYRKQHGDWVYCGRFIWPWQKSKFSFVNSTHDTQDIRYTHLDHKPLEEFKLWAAGKGTL